MEAQILQSLILEVTEVWYIQGTMHLSGKFAQDSKLKFTVGFWCQTIHKKFLRRFDTTFDLKMMDEKWSRKNYFEIPRWPSELLLPSAKKSAQKG